MNHLCNAINRLMRNQPKLTAKEVAIGADIDESYFSRIRAGTQDRISPQKLSSLARVLGRNREERATLIAAHMRDESCGYVPGTIQILVRDKPLSERESLDPEIEYLQKHLSDSRIRDAVRSIVKLHRDTGNKSGNR